MVVRVTAEPGGQDVSLVYTYRPSLLGAPWQFTLGPEGLHWTAGNRSGRIAYRQVRRVRMSYRPANMQSYRFVTELWGEGAPKLRIASTSWKSMVEQERLDKAYAAFLVELHRRLAEAGAPVLYQKGIYPLVFWAGLIVFAGVALGMAALSLRALWENAWGAAAFIGAFLLLFLWQGGNFFRRNRPGVYRPDALPKEIVPKG